MKVSCPQCEQLLALPTKSVGRWARCPRCGAIFALDPAVGRAVDPTMNPNADRGGLAPESRVGESATTLSATAPGSTWQPISSHEKSPGAVDYFGVPRSVSSTSSSEANEASSQTTNDVATNSVPSVPVSPPPLGLNDWAANLMVQQGQWELQIVDGRRFGPVSREVLDQWVREGRVGVDSLLRPESERHWSPAQRLYPYLRTGHGIGRGGTANRPPASIGSQAGSYGSPVVSHNQGGLTLFLAIFGVCCFPLSLCAIVLAVIYLIKVRRGTAQREGSYLLWVSLVIAILGFGLQLGMFAR